MTPESRAVLISPERIEHAILLVRGQKVLLDADLAALYAVETKQLVRAVKRNIDRFPHDFAFQLTAKEFTDLKCQTGTSSSWGGRRTRHRRLSAGAGSASVTPPAGFAGGAGLERALSELTRVAGFVCPGLRRWAIAARSCGAGGVETPKALPILAPAGPGRVARSERAW